MKISSLFPSAATVALLAAAIFASGATAQAPATADPQGPPPWMHERNFPKPTNLKVLPKDLTGKQVRDIMEKWAGSLGVHCDNCHQADPTKIGRNGKPELNFPDDTKPQKKIARLMYTMTEQLNKDTISKAMQMDPSDEGAPVTCGTCHRGQKYPPEFVIPKEEHRPPAGGDSQQPNHGL